MQNPDKKSLLNKFIKAVEDIIEDAGRMSQLAPLLDTRDGAVQAVGTVLGTIEQRAPIPPEIKSLLAARTYFLMVDMLQEAHEQKPDIQAVHQTLLAIMKAFAPNKQTAQAVPQPGQQPAQQPAGLINGAAA